LAEQTENIRGYAVQLRTAFVPVSEGVITLFGDVNTCVDKQGNYVVEVRGLNGVELYRRNQFYQEDYAFILEGIQKGLLQANKSQMAAAVGRALGHTPEGEKELDPAELEAKKFIVSVGVLVPKLSVGQVYHLMLYFPLDFEKIATKILELTGMGASVKKKP
jgi:hypothetical protein